MICLPSLNLRHPDKYFAFADSAARSLARFAIAILVARLTGGHGYGGFAILLTIEVIAGALLNSLFVAPMVSIAPGLPEPDRSALLRRTVRRTARWSVGAGAVCLLALPFVARLETSFLALAGACASIATWGACQGARGWRQSIFGSRTALGADLAGLLIPVVIVLVAAPLGLDVVATFWWASALGGLVAFRLFGRPPGGVEPVSGEVASRVRRMGVHMSLGTVANTLCSRIQPFVLAVAGGAHVVACFAAASTLIGPVRLLSMTISGVLRPRLALYIGRGRADEARRLVMVSTISFALVGMLATAGFVVLGEWLVVCIFGEAFRDASGVLPWAAPFATIEAIGTVFVVLMQVGHRNGAAITTGIRTAATVLSLAIIWPACVRFGPAGAFAAAGAVELVFLGLLVDRVVRDQVLASEPHRVPDLL
ncbi:MAG: lipopolysaccharide biosynthesis protein [Planctomycetota bacterium]|jgi:O-antigen/teichoic acid export membrane protein